MSSNKILALVLLIFVAAGCARRNDPYNTPIIAAKGTGTCLSNLDGQVTAFANGEMNAEGVDAFWSCMKASITKFESVTVGDGANGDQYSPESLRTFIETYFYHTRHINDLVLADILKIKRVLVGGSEKYVTRAELLDLNQLFEELRAVTQLINPNIRVILRKDKNANDDQVRQAGTNLNQALLRVGGWLSRKNQSYDFQSLTTAANDIANWMQDGGKDSSNMKTLRQAAIVIPSAKSILVGGNAKAIDGADWLPMMNAISRGLYTYLAAANGYDSNLDAALIRSILPESAQTFIGALAQSAQNHSGKTIKMQEFTNLFTALGQTDWLPTEMTPTSIGALWTWFLKRPLGDFTAAPAGLSLSQIGTLQQKIGAWLTLLNAPSTDSSPLVQQFNAMMAVGHPTTWDNQGRMLYPNAFPGAWTADGRRHMTWPYVILGWLKDSYVGAATPTLTIDNMNLAASEILPLLQNFGWLQKTQLSIGKRILLEADLFTLASNGDGLLDLNEGSRYIALIMSSFRSAQIWIDTAKKACGSNSVDCVHSMAGQANSGVLGAMPRLQALVPSWGGSQMTAYIQHSEQTVLGGNETGTFGTGDLLQTYQLMGYVETFMELYDANHDDHIDLGEATVAFKVFGPTLGRLLSGAGLGDQQVLEFFTFMMKYGDTPFTMFGGQIAFNNWQWFPNTWVFAADRNVLMSILNQLATLAR